MNNLHSSVWAVLVGIVFLVAGGFVLHAGGKFVAHDRAESNWPSVEGTVVSSRVEGPRPHDPSQSSSSTFGVSVVYRYRFGGEEFVGSENPVGGYYTSNRSSVREKAKIYSVGNIVPVHVNPNNPGESLLETGIGLVSLLTVLVGIGATGAGLFITGKSIRIRRETAS